MKGWACIGKCHGKGGKAHPQNPGGFPKLSQKHPPLIAAKGRMDRSGKGRQQVSGRLKKKSQESQREMSDAKTSCEAVLRCSGRESKHLYSPAVATRARRRDSLHPARLDTVQIARESRAVTGLCREPKSPNGVKSKARWLGLCPLPGLPHWAGGISPACQFLHVTNVKTA